MVGVGRNWRFYSNGLYVSSTLDGRQSDFWLTLFGHDFDVLETDQILLILIYEVTVTSSHLDSLLQLVVIRLTPAQGLFMEILVRDCSVFML